MIEAALYSRLTGYAGLAALVSTRVYPILLPQSPTYPAVVYERRITERQSAMGVDTDVVSAMFTVEAHGSTFDSARDVATQIIGALQRFSGTVESVEILDVFIDGEDFEYDPDTKTTIIRVDCLFWHRE